MRLSSRMNGWLHPTEPPKYILMFSFSSFPLDPLTSTALVSAGAEGEPESHAPSLLSSAGLTRCDKPSSQTAALSCVHIKQRESSLGSIDNHRQAKACQAVKAPLIPFIIGPFILQTTGRVSRSGSAVAATAGESHGRNCHLQPCRHSRPVSRRSTSVMVPLGWIYHQVASSPQLRSRKRILQNRQLTLKVAISYVDVYLASVWRCVAYFK